MGLPKLSQLYLAQAVVAVVKIYSQLTGEMEGATAVK
jgi:hypothetical protein